MSETTEKSSEILDADARADAHALQNAGIVADPDTLRLMFTDARTHYGWQNKPVSDALLRAIYDLTKWGPTSFNMQPMRLVFVKSQAAKERLKPALPEFNLAKTMSAPVTAIVAHDLAFYERWGQFFPVSDQSGMFRNDKALGDISAFRNATLQAGYFILAARALGLDCGPMSGFDNATVDAAFFAGTQVKSNFLINMGYADTAKIFRRLPRFAFDEVATIL
jgi:3-hydroxypropanoate dehydrogenase